MVAMKDVIASADDSPPISEDRASNSAALGESVLYSKGSASASGFRPWYWSYERDGNPPHGSSGTVTPFRSNAPPFPGAVASVISTPARRSSTRSRALLAIGGAAALLSTSFFLYPDGRRASDQPAPSSVNAVQGPEFAFPGAPTPMENSPQDAPILIARGDQLLATGDIVAARVFYERAVEQGSAQAAMDVGKTYDPFFLEEMHARGIRGNAAIAATWYRKASAAGDWQADLRLKRLMARSTD